MQPSAQRAKFVPFFLVCTVNIGHVQRQFSHAGSSCGREMKKTLSLCPFLSADVLPSPDSCVPNRLRAESIVLVRAPSRGDTKNHSEVKHQLSCPETDT